MEQQVFNISVTKKSRLDIFIAEFLSVQEITFSRNKVQKLINDSKVRVNNKIVIVPKTIVKESDKIEFIFEFPKNNQIHEIKPLDYKLDIVYEDDDIIIVNKPNDMVVHQSVGHTDDTLVNALTFHTKKLSSLNGENRLGIVHRIDKQTTGLIVVAKTDVAMLSLQQQIKDHKVRREYKAIIHGNLEYDNIKIDAPIGRDAKDRKKMSVTSKNSRPAVTNLTVIKRFSDFTFVRLILETGRTHQIRVHLKYINHPVLGDQKYGKLKDKKSKYGQYLHAAKLVFTHPTTNVEMEFEAELPSIFKMKLEELK